jgi:DNA-binding LacI/PurR family transcriptional regulator
MRQRILKEAEAQGYVPNRMARALVTGRTNQIALCFPVVTSPLAQDLSRQFQKLAHPTSYDLLTVSTEGARHHSGLLAVDGAFFFGSAPENIPLHCPVVEILLDLRGTSAGFPPRQDVILVNLEKASRAAINHLLERGARRIAYVSTPTAMNSCEPRYRAYSAALRKAGLPVEKITVNLPPDEFHRELTHQALEKYFSRQGFPDAIFCSNDEIAIGAYRALRQFGRRIPEETAVMGCHDYDEAPDHVPPLSSIRLPVNDICRCAWEMLTARIQNPALPPQQQLFDAQLIVRQSSLWKGPSSTSSPRTRESSNVGAG